MPLIHGYSDATRSKNIAKLRREGYPAKQAVAAAYKIQREELKRHHMSTRRLARRRQTGLARFNPSNIAWGWLGGGAAVGAAGFIGWGATHRNPAAPPATTRENVMNGVGGAGAGMAAGGLVGGIVKGSGATVAAGLVGGLALMFAPVLFGGFSDT